MGNQFQWSSDLSKQSTTPPTEWACVVVNYQKVLRDVHNIYLGRKVYDICFVNVRQLCNVDRNGLEHYIHDCNYHCSDNVSIPWNKSDQTFEYCVRCHQLTFSYDSVSDAYHFWNKVSAYWYANVNHSLVLFQVLYHLQDILGLNSWIIKNSFIFIVHCSIFDLQVIKPCLISVTLCLQSDSGAQGKALYFI
jgi:hypothetical protein